MSGSGSSEPDDEQRLRMMMAMIVADRKHTSRTAALFFFVASVFTLWFLTEPLRSMGYEPWAMPVVAVCAFGFFILSGVSALRAHTMKRDEAQFREDFEIDDLDA